MSDMMTFPDTWEEYEKLYGFNDSEEIYTNNSRLIPSFRVKQWLDHEPERKKGKWIVYKAPDKQHCGLVNCPFCGEDMIAEADEYNFALTAEQI